MHVGPILDEISSLECWQRPGHDDRTK